jgi:TRAP-type C4-dicarboxylate transport system permease small subunit
VDWIRRRAENVVAGLLGIMFLAFILQIVFRYFFNFPIGWTSELSVIAWLYMTLLGSAFWLKESDEIRFDLVSGTLGPVGRRVIGLVVAVAAIVLFAMALPATVKYVAFMKVESSSYLKIRLDILYSIYVIFAVAVIVRYLWTIVGIVRGEAPEDGDITKASSGL